MLKTIELFSHLSPSQLASIEYISLIREYQKGEILFYQGDQNQYFHFLLKGEVSIFKSTPSAEPMVVHRFLAPSLIAEVATLKAIPYPASAECISDVSVLKIQRDPFLSLMHQDPGLSIALIASLADKIGVLERSLQRHSAPNTMAKVARLILDDPGIFTRLKSTEIALFLNTTPETLSRTLRKLKDNGIVSYALPKNFKILNGEELLKYAEKEITT